MAVIAVVSAKGSPGATTTMVALTRAWARAQRGRRAIGIDFDPCGGDVAAGVLAGAAPGAAGVLALATWRTDGASPAVESAAVPLDSDRTAALVPGVPDAARAGAIPLAWDVLSDALPELDGDGVDLIIDGGRLDGTAPVPAWLDAADRVLLVVRASLPWVNAAHRLARACPAPARTALVVVEAPSPYSPREVARAVGLPLLGAIPQDPRSAAVHSDGASPARGYGRSPFARAIEHLASQLANDARPADSGGDGRGLAAAAVGPANGETRGPGDTVTRDGVGGAP